jgi:hypothetical protein
VPMRQQLRGNNVARAAEQTLQVRWYARSIQAPLQRTQLRRSRIPPSLSSLCPPSPSSRRAACAPAAPQQVCARICCARALAVIPLYSLYTTFPLFISNFDFDMPLQRA